MTPRFQRKRLIILAALLIPVLLISAELLLIDTGPKIASSPSGEYTSFTVNGKTYKFTYVATNSTELAKGLMGRKVTSSTFELFVFPNAGFYSFWMYGMNASLDIMWLYTVGGSDTGTFVYIVHDVPPCAISIDCAYYESNSSANYVIEAQAGFAAAHGITAGTPVTLN